ncbi:MAG: PPC domain-containing protein [Verrucomicrobiota bacterium]
MNRLILSKTILCAAACLFTWPALAGSPRVSFVYPSAGQRGAESEIECRGGNLEDGTGALFDEPGFEVTAIKAEKGKFRIKVKIAPDVRLGEHTFRVLTASGVADLRLFYVSPFPVIEEIEQSAPDPKVPRALTPSTQSQPVALGTTIAGRTQGEDQDRFEVEAKKGERISAEVIGARLQTQQIYDPDLTITKADGTRLLEVDDTPLTRQDPVASVIAPEDGKYIITVKEATNSGQGECHYLLNIGSFPRPLAIYPNGGPAGEDLKVTLIGDASGPAEKTIKLPAEPAPRFAVFSEEGQPTPQPNFVRASPFPNVLEAEPNNAIEAATPANTALPLALNGIIGEKDDVDLFKISAKKGEIFEVKVFARQLRSPLDSVLAILDAKGKQVVANDDEGQLDSGLRWTVGADGDYFVRIDDKLQRGGPLFTYRVELTPVRPGIALWLPEMVQNSNQERRAVVIPKGNRYASLVRVKRNDFAGEVELSARDLPAGVTISGTQVDKSVDAVPMVFEVGADAAPMGKAFALEARPVEKGAPVQSMVEQDIDVAENGNQKSFYAVREDRLVVSVTDEIPVKIDLVAPKVPVLQNGAISLKVVAERKNDFKGPIGLTLLFTPPGLGTAGTVQIPEGQNEGIVTLSANGNAPLQKWKVCVVGSADFGKGPVWFSTALAEVGVAAPYVSGQIMRSFVDQGETTTITVKLENKIPFEGKAKLSLLGLPPNTTAEDVEITQEDKVAKFTVKAAANAPTASHKQLFCQFQLMKDGEPMISSFAQGGILRIDKAATPTAATAQK